MPDNKTTASPAISQDLRLQITRIAASREAPENHQLVTPHFHTPGSIGLDHVCAAICWTLFLGALVAAAFWLASVSGL
jgi:hypothetical protein